MLLCTSASYGLTLSSHMSIGTTNTKSKAMPTATLTSSTLLFNTLDGHGKIRYDLDQHRCSWNGLEMKMNKSTVRKWKTPYHQTRRTSDSAYPLFTNQLTKESSPHKIYHEAVKAARGMFTQEMLFQSKDKNISLAKALLYVAAEDEAFMALNREIDSRSLQSERTNTSVQPDPKDWDSVEQMPLAGRTISEWLNELDIIAKEVEAELVSREIGCHYVEVLKAVNVVFFELRGFKRAPVLADFKYSYLHSVLGCRCGSAILLSIIYIEVCRRIGLTIVGSRVGEDFLIWPQVECPEELFKVDSGHSLLAIINGGCVEDPKSMASDLTSSSLSGLEITSNKDIVGIALANLIRLHWRRASRSNHGLMLTSPLRHDHDANAKYHNINVPLLRPQDLS